MELDGQNFDQNIEVHKRLAPAQVREPDAARAAADRLSGAQEGCHRRVSVCTSIVLRIAVVGIRDSCRPGRRDSSVACPIGDVRVAGVVLPAKGEPLSGHARCLKIHALSAFFCGSPRVRQPSSCPLSPQGFARRFQNHVDYNIRVCIHRSVINGVRANFGTHTLGHEALRLRINHAVFFRHQIP